ncbi:nuclear transport factor 2 family protein [Streptomyces sp. BBFR102]|uniref:nuclear transport factor 2 family protein n=1 Tax=Streptomyces sp. BBFR102 TaxID=3448171 RepID=UPI003F53C5DC
MSDPASSAPAARFRAAVETATTTGDLSGFNGLFRPDVRLYSPVSFTSFDGEATVLGLLGVLIRTFENFRYIGTFTGEAATSRDREAPASPADVLLFRADVDGREIHGMDLLHFDEAGLITEITVMVRPRSAVQALGQAVLRGLVEAGLVPAE